VVAPVRKAHVWSVAQVITVVGLSLFLVVGADIWSDEGVDSLGSVIVIVASVLIAREVRPPLTVQPDEVVVRNPLWTHRLPHSEVADTTTGRSGLWTILVIERTDGGTLRAVRVAQLSGTGAVWRARRLLSS
jgi:hypothetical protein